MGGHRERRLILLLAGVSMTGPLSMQIYLPALPLVREAFGVPVAVAQLTLSISVLSIAPAVLVYGPLADRYGRRRVLLGGMTIFLLGSVTCALAPDIWWLVAGRTIQAVGAACGLVIARAIVSDLYTSEDVVRMFATLTMAMIVGPTVSPFVGGLMTDAFGWRSVFLLVSAFGLGLIWLTGAGLRETGQIGGDVRIAGLLDGFKRLARRPVFFGYAMHGAFSLAVFYSFISAAPYVMVNILDRPATEYGLYFLLLSGGYFSGNLVASRVSGRVGGDRMILIGAIVSVCFAMLGLVAALSVSWRPIVFFAPMTVIAFSFGLSAPNSQAGAIGGAADVAGTASSSMGFLQQALGAVVIQAVGMLLGETPYPMLLFMLAGTLMGLITILATIGYKRRVSNSATQREDVSRGP